MPDTELESLTPPLTEEQSCIFPIIQERARIFLGVSSEALKRGYAGKGDVVDFLCHDLKCLFQDGHILDNDTLEKELDWLYTDYRQKSGLWFD